MRVGAIDIGSNSIRLLVADLIGPEGELTAVARAGEPCRLGRGIQSTGLIEGEIAERAAAVSAEFARRAEATGAVHILVAATAALRTAANGPEVGRLIAERCGRSVRILTGEEEATLVYRAVVLGLGALARRNPCMIFDLGGGSTEVVSGVGERPGRWVSLGFGAVTLTERFAFSDPPLDSEIQALRTEVQAEVMHHCALMPLTTPILAGVGGTVTALGSLDRGLTAYDPTLIEGWIIEPSRLEKLTGTIARSSEAERRGWAVMGEGRADIVVAGVLVVEVLAKRFPSRGLVCSTQGLRYGLARVAAAELAAMSQGDT